MSSHKTSKAFEATQTDVSQACRYALNEMKLSIKKDGGSNFVAKEQFKMLGFSYPAKIEVQIKDDANRVKVLVNSSNMGFGPVQGGHVKTVAETFLSKVQYKLSEGRRQVPQTSVADELQKLAALREQGVLSEEEFEAAKRKLI